MSNQQMYDAAALQSTDDEQAVPAVPTGRVRRAGPPGSSAGRRAGPPGRSAARSDDDDDLDDDMSYDDDVSPDEDDMSVDPYASTHARWQKTSDELDAMLAASNKAARQQAIEKERNKLRVLQATDVLKQKKLTAKQAMDRTHKLERECVAKRRAIQANQTRQLQAAEVAEASQEKTVYDLQKLQDEADRMIQNASSQMRDPRSLTSGLMRTEELAYPVFTSPSTRTPRGAGTPRTHARTPRSDGAAGSSGRGGSCTPERMARLEKARREARVMIASLEEERDDLTRALDCETGALKTETVKLASLETAYNNSQAELASSQAALASAQAEIAQLKAAAAAAPAPAPAPFPVSTVDERKLTHEIAYLKSIIDAMEKVPKLAVNVSGSFPPLGGMKASIGAETYAYEKAIVPTKFATMEEDPDYDSESANIGVPIAGVKKRAFMELSYAENTLLHPGDNYLHCAMASPCEEMYQMANFIVDEWTRADQYMRSKGHPFTWMDMPYNGVYYLQHGFINTLYHEGVFVDTGSMYVVDKSKFLASNAWQTLAPKKLNLCVEDQGRVTERVAACIGVYMQAVKHFGVSKAFYSTEMVLRCKLSCTSKGMSKPNVLMCFVLVLGGNSVCAAIRPSKHAVFV